MILYLLNRNQSSDGLIYCTVLAHPNYMAEGGLYPLNKKVAPYLKVKLSLEVPLSSMKELILEFKFLSLQ